MQDISEAGSKGICEANSIEEINKIISKVDRTIHIQGIIPSLLNLARRKRHVETWPAMCRQKGILG